MTLENLNICIEWNITAHVFDKIPPPLRLKQGVAGNAHFQILDPTLDHATGSYHQTFNGIIGEFML